jgi:hypothetical protein
LDLSGFALSFTAELIRDPISFTDHAFVHTLAHIFHVVHALESEIKDPDTEIAGSPVSFLQDLRFDHPSSHCDAIQDLQRFHVVLHHLGCAVAAAHQVDQFVVGHGIARFTIEDIVQPGLTGTFIAQSDEELQWIGDLPTCVSVNYDELLVLGRHLVHVAIPFEVTLVEELGFLDERDLEMHARIRSRCSNRFTELGYNGLLRLVENEHCAEHDRQEDRTENKKDDVADAHVHFAFSIAPMFNSGSTLLLFSSTMILLPTLGSTRSSVSR